MNQTIYCDCFYCEHYEDGKCLAPILHLSNCSSCREFTPSEEKLNAYLNTHTPNAPKEYGEYTTPPSFIRIRQK